MSVSIATQTATGDTHETAGLIGATLEIMTDERTTRTTQVFHGLGGDTESP